MRVQIVESKKDVLKLTPEELSTRSFIGLLANDTKYIATKINREIALIGGIWTGGYAQWSTYADMKSFAMDAIKDTRMEIHVFETSQEMFQWLAE